MNSLELKYIESLSFTVPELGILNKVAEYKGKQELFFNQNPEILIKLSQITLVESVESSNRIEGIEVPNKKIQQLCLNGEMPVSRPEQEIMGYKEALSLINDSADYMEISVNLILQLHKILFKYTSIDGGHFKTNDNQIVEKDSANNITKVRFVPTKAFQTSYAMEELCHSYKQRLKEGIDSLVLIPLFILDFLCIHPFNDGNGRISRLLTHLLCLKSGYEVVRFVSLERIVEQTKEGYYRSLENSSIGWHEKQHTSKYFLMYLLQALMASYKEFSDKASSLPKKRGEKSQAIIDIILKKEGWFSVDNIYKLCPYASKILIKQILAQLRDKGLIESNKGQGVNSLWKVINSFTI